MPIGVYIHIPYCHSKCFYCDFYSKPLESTRHAYIDALIQECALRANECNGPIETLYIGGGTPSSLHPESLRSLIEGIGKHLDISRVKEFTMEVNPEDVTDDNLTQWVSMGVNRLSMGIQSLDDSLLQAIGRRHSAVQAIKAAELINRYFDNFSLDIMYGLPGQSIDTLDNTLQGILSLGATHLSAYHLSFEPGTRMYAMLLAGKVDEVDENVSTAMYNLVRERLTVAGYCHYEISNFSLPGYHSRHNSNYWNSTPYLGLGASAHSFDGLIRRYNSSSITTYIDTISKGECAYIIDEETPINRFNDFIITRLRTSTGIDTSTIDISLQPYWNEIQPEISHKLTIGQLAQDGPHIYIPSELWLTADAIMRDLIIADNG